MASDRRLVLRREAMTELADGELRELAAGTRTDTTTVVETRVQSCHISEFAISLCECLTQFCGSIDIC